MIDRLVKMILGQYLSVSRREYVNLLCDNAALTSAVEQKERARVAAVAETRRLQRALDNTRHTIEAQAAHTERVYRVCYVNGQGYGYIDPSGWERVPCWARARVQVLALCQSEAIAQAVVKCLPRGWRDSGTYYNPQTNEMQWTVVE
jgi:hypothetical protein